MDANHHSNRQNWPGLDWLKFLCVFFMICNHAFYWVATDNGMITYPADCFIAPLVNKFMFVAMFSLMIPFTAGCMVCWGLEESHGPNQKMELKTIALICSNAVVLWFLGGVTNWLAAGRGAFLAWNVLQFMALSIIVIVIVLRVMSIPGVLSAGILTLVCTEPLRQLFIGDRRYLPRIIFGDVDDNHAWPFFPWFATVVCGYIVTHCYRRYSGHRHFDVTAMTCGVMMIVGAVSRKQLIPTLDNGNIIGPSLFMPASWFVVGLMGVAIVLLMISTWAFAKHRFRRYGIVTSYSRGILLIYIIHMAVGHRLSFVLHRHVDPGYMMAHLWEGYNPVIWIGYPLLLLSLSWLVGFLAIKYLLEKRFHIQLRKVK